MSGFWTLKIGKNKQDEKKSGKENDNKKASGKSPSRFGRSLNGKTPEEAEKPVNSVQTSDKKEIETSFPTTELNSLSHQSETKEDLTVKTHPDPTADFRNEQPGQSGEKKYNNQKSLRVKVIEKNTLYSENIELVIHAPLEPAAISKLYNSLEMTPEIKVLYTSGSWDRSTVITVSLEKPVPLVDIITNVQGLNVSVLEPDQSDNSKKSASTILGTNKKKITRIDLLVKMK